MTWEDAAAVVIGDMEDVVDEHAPTPPPPPPPLLPAADADAETEAFWRCSSSASKAKDVDDGRSSSRSSAKD